MTAILFEELRKMAESMSHVHCEFVVAAFVQNTWALRRIIFIILRRIRSHLRLIFYSFLVFLRPLMFISALSSYLRLHVVSSTYLVLCLCSIVSRHLLFFLSLLGCHSCALSLLFRSFSTPFLFVLQV